jgi:hypothetical protein
LGLSLHLAFILRRHSLKRFGPQTHLDLGLLNFRVLEQRLKAFLGPNDIVLAVLLLEDAVVLFGILGLGVAG